MVCVWSIWKQSLAYIFAGSSFCWGSCQISLKLSAFCPLYKPNHQSTIQPSSALWCEILQSKLVIQVWCHLDFQKCQGCEDYLGNSPISMILRTANAHDSANYVDYPSKNYCSAKMGSLDLQELKARSFSNARILVPISLVCDWLIVQGKPLQCHLQWNRQTRRVRDYW